MKLKANGNLIKSLIVGKGLNLSKFASNIGISRPYLSQILNGTKKPSILVAFKVAEGLGKGIEDIFFIDNRRYINELKKVINQ